MRISKSFRYQTRAQIPTIIDKKYQNMYGFYEIIAINVYDFTQQGYKMINSKAIPQLISYL